MKLVIQRVNNAKVTVGSKTVGGIGKGLFVLFGAGANDTKKEAEALAKKLIKLRIMSDDSGKMNLSVLNTDFRTYALDPNLVSDSGQDGYHTVTRQARMTNSFKARKPCSSSILVVSQFTLYADTSGGNRPSFIKAKEPHEAEELYKYFVEVLKNKGIDVQTGVFGEYMKIECELDGPVTITLGTDET